MSAMTQGTKYSITYTYDNPSNAGPFKGKALVPDKYSKGDMFFAVFGRARVLSCRLIKDCGASANQTQSCV